MSRKRIIKRDDDDVDVDAERESKAALLLSESSSSHSNHRGEKMSTIIGNAVFNPRDDSQLKFNRTELSEIVTAQQKTINFLKLILIILILLATTALVLGLIFPRPGTSSTASGPLPPGPPGPPGATGSTGAPGVAGPPGESFPEPCTDFECDSVTFGDVYITGDTYIEQNVTIDEHLQVRYIWLYNQSSQTYFDVYNAFTNITVPPTNYTCFLCNGTDMEILNNVIINGGGIIGNTNDTEMLVVYNPTWFYNTVVFHAGLESENITTNVINLFNGTSYYDLGDTIQTIIDMQNMIKANLSDHETRIDIIEVFIDSLEFDNCTVIQICGPAMDVQAALDAAVLLLPSVNNHVGIEFCPGTYVINNTASALTIPPYVYLTSRVTGAAHLTPMNPGNAIFDLYGSTTLHGFTFSNGLTPYLLQVDEQGLSTQLISNTMLDGAMFYGSIVPLFSQNPDHSVRIEASQFIANQGSVSSIITLDGASNVYITDCVFFHSNASLGVGVSVLSSISRLDISSVRMNSLSIGVHVNAPITDTFMVTSMIARSISNAAIAFASNITAPNQMRVHALDTDDSVLHEIIETTNATITYMYGFGDVYTYNCTEGPKPAFLDAVYIETDADLREQASLRASIDVSIGTPEKPHALYTGTGKHTSRNLLAFITAANDPAVRVDKLLCRELPQTLSSATNSSLYVSVSSNDFFTSGPFQHFGLILTIDTTIAANSDIHAEYWDGTTWQRYGVMEYVYGGNYASHSNDIFNTAGTIVINYDYNIEFGYTRNGTTVGSWTANDPVGLGFDRMWVRFRVDQTLPGDVVISYIAHTGNTVEHRASGVTLYHGRARMRSHLQYSPVQLIDSTGSASSFQYFTAVIPGDADTSVPFQMILHTFVQPDNTTYEIKYTFNEAGDTILSAPFASIIDDGFMPTTDPRVITDQKLLTVSPNLVQTLIYMHIFLDDSNCYNGVLAPSVMRLRVEMISSVDDSGEALILAVQFLYTKRMRGETLAFL